MNITHDMSNDLTEYDPESRQVDGPNPIENRISSSAARVPDIISCTSGITVQGRQLHSFAFTTDAAIIRNTNADAILAVYPFTGEPVITQALLTAAQAPLFVGVGGGTTTGPRVIQLAMMAEMQGAAGVVLNAPAPPSTVYDVARITNTPVIATVLTCDDELDEKIEAGASIINVAAGRRTPDVVQQIRQRHPPHPAARQRRFDRRVHGRNHRGRRERADLDPAERAGDAALDDDALSRRIHRRQHAALT